MSFNKGFRAPQERVVDRFARYLNGPMGRTVLETLDEGESFILQTSDHTFRVTKRHRIFRVFWRKFLKNVTLHQKFPLQSGLHSVSWKERVLNVPQDARELVHGVFNVEVDL